MNLIHLFYNIECTCKPCFDWLLPTHYNRVEASFFLDANNLFGLTSMDEETKFMLIRHNHVTATIDQQFCFVLLITHILYYLTDIFTTFHSHIFDLYSY